MGTNEAEHIVLSHDCPKRLGSAWPCLTTAIVLLSNQASLANPALLGCSILMLSLPFKACWEPNTCREDLSSRIRWKSAPAGRFGVRAPNHNPYCIRHWQSSQQTPLYLPTACYTNNKILVSQQTDWASVRSASTIEKLANSNTTSPYLLAPGVMKNVVPGA